MAPAILGSVGVRQVVSMLAGPRLTLIIATVPTLGVVIAAASSTQQLRPKWAVC